MSHINVLRSTLCARTADDECLKALVRMCAEVLKLRHEYAQHPEGWVARKKRSNAVKEPLQRWAVTDNGSTCSRVGPNYQVCCEKVVCGKGRGGK